MRVKVTKDDVIIEERNKVHEEEVNVNEIVFEFSEEYNQLTKKAIFQEPVSDIKKEQPIIDNKCIIPNEILKSYDRNIQLRVYGYETELINNESKIKIRYSPAFTTFPVEKGSYISGASGSEEVTPSQFEQYMDAMNRGLNEVANVDIDAERESEKAVISITNRHGETKSVEVYDGDSGMIWFDIDEDGYLVGYSEHQNNLDKYYIDTDGYFCIDLPIERGA